MDLSAVGESAAVRVYLADAADSMESTSFLRLVYMKLIYMRKSDHQGKRNKNVNNEQNVKWCQGI